MEIPVLDLKKQYKLIQKEIENSVKQVLKNGHYILGPNVDALEKAVATYCGTSYAIGVASGTDALRLSLLSLGIGKDDEVITTPFTFIATAQVITQIGARTVLVDVEEDTFNMDPDKIEEAITEKTKAILIVHIFGHTMDMRKLLSIAKKYNLFLIEDAAQSFGSECNTALFDSPSQWKKAGAMGDVGCLSFYPTKNLGGFGDGGMVITNKKEIADKMRILRVHGGNTNNYSYDLLGYNSRLDELQAAILRIKLHYVDEWTKLRERRASLYNKILFKIPSIEVPICKPYTKHSFHAYTIKTSLRDKLKEHLGKHGISTKIYYPIPVHLQKMYKNLNYDKLNLPVAEKICKQVLSLPVYPELEEEKILYVARKIVSFFK